MKYGYYCKGWGSGVFDARSFYDGEPYSMYIHYGRWELVNYVPLFLHKLDLLHVNELLKTDLIEE